MILDAFIFKIDDSGNVKINCGGGDQLGVEMSGMMGSKT
jgi:hypothetical protein